MPCGAIAGSGWASGLNLYATVLLLGLAGRLGWSPTPAELQRTPVLVAAGALYAIEFVADKIPYVDNAWDVAHTIIRPLGAAWLATVLAGEPGGVSAPLAAVVSAVLALTSHGAKATTRAAVNVSPEPFSNIALSVGEDGIVAAMIALALAHPAVAAVAAVVLALLCTLVVWRLARFVRGILRRVTGGRRA